MNYLYLSSVNYLYLSSGAADMVWLWQCGSTLWLQCRSSRISNIGNSVVAVKIGCFQSSYRTLVRFAYCQCQLRGV